MRSKNAINFLILTILIGASFFIVTRMQDFSDWLALRNYTPSSRIVKLADDTTMQPDTRRLFYVNHPELNDKKTFNDKCRTVEQSIVLGCYISHDGIFLLDVEDPRLKGVIEVTAAHEVLHAAYDRLSGSERTQVDKMTAEFFAQLNDERIKNTIENYKKKDPSVVPNELHSILGTEVTELTPALEAHYAKYFKDRKKIAAYSSQYEQTFVNLRNKVADLDAELDSIKKQVDANQQEITNKNNELDSKRAQLDRLLANDQIEEYNAEVGNFNQLVGSYNRLINSTKQLISRYNSIVEERNSIATQEQELVEAIDSNSVPSEKTQ